LIYIVQTKRHLGTGKSIEIILKILQAIFW